MRKASFLVCLVLSFTNFITINSNATEPVYSDSNVPILEDLNYRLEIIDSLHLKASIEFVASYKVNPISSVYFNFTAPVASALEKPCMSNSFYKEKGVQTITDLGNNRSHVISIVNITLNQYYSGISMDICKGKWGLQPTSENQNIGTNIYIYDIAGHYRKYFSASAFPATYQQNSFYQESSLWSLTNAIKPKCKQINGTIFEICDSPFDFSKLANAYVVITDQMISDVKTREAKEKADAEAKAKADKADKQTTILKNSLFAEIAKIEELINLKLSIFKESQAIMKITAYKDNLKTLSTEIANESTLSPGDKLSNYKENLDRLLEAVTITSEPKTVILVRTITCIKGKTVKKVTGINPKCPSGYKKK